MKAHAMPATAMPTTQRADAHHETASSIVQRKSPLLWLKALAPPWTFHLNFQTQAQRAALLPVSLMAALAFSACTPTVKVATDQPITINLNVNIKHEIRVKVDKELDSLFSEDSDIF